MCSILARGLQEQFVKSSRSVRIAGHSTSISLEAAFWQVLEDIAGEEGVSLSKLISQLYDEALEQHGSLSNLTSMLRTVCLLYQEERCPRGTVARDVT